MHRQQFAFQLPEMYAAVLLTALLGYAINVVLRVTERRVVFWVGEERVHGVRSARPASRPAAPRGRRLRRARSSVWELWAAPRTRSSFHRRARSWSGRGRSGRHPSSCRTWRRSLKRLAAGFAIGAGIGIVVGLLMGARRARTARARPARRARAGDTADRGRSRADRRARPRRRDADRGHRVRHVLPGPDRHRRGSSRRLARGPRHGVDAAGRPRRTRLPDLPSRRAPVDRRRPARRALDRPRAGRHLRVRRRGDGLGRYILDQQGQFNVPEMYAGHPLPRPARVRAEPPLPARGAARARVALRSRR